MGFTRVPLYSLVFHCRAIGGALQRHPLETADVGWFSPDAMPFPVAALDRWGAAAFAAIHGEPVEVQFDKPRAPVVARRRLTRRAPVQPDELLSSASTIDTLPWLDLPRVADAVVVDEAGTVGRDAERFGHRRGERRWLDLVAVGGERFEPIPELIERRGWLVAIGERECGDREQLVGVDIARSLVSGSRMEPPLECRATGTVVTDPDL